MLTVRATAMKGCDLCSPFIHPSLLGDHISWHMEPQTGITLKLWFSNLLVSIPLSCTTFHIREVFNHHPTHP